MNHVRRSLGEGGYARHLRPLGDRVLVWKNKPDDTSAGGIVISSNTAMPSLIQGDIIRCGSKCTEDFKVKDAVIFSRYAGISIDDSDLVILKESEIIGFVSKKRKE